MIDAVVLAGGEDRGDIAAETGVIYRPLLDVGGKPILQRLLAALRGASEVDRVCLVAPPEVQAVASEIGVDLRVESGESFLDNLQRGVEETEPGTDQVLVITGDLPLVTPAAINDLVRQSASARADVAYAIIPKDSCERQFPGGRRTYVRLKDGTFTGGNGVVLTRQFVAMRGELIGRLYAVRKNPVKLAALLGIGFLFRLVTGRLRIAQLEARASQLVGGRVAAVISTYPELGFDVDKLEDLNLARRAAESFDTS